VQPRQTLNLKFSNGNLPSSGQGTDSQNCWNQVFLHIAGMMINQESTDQHGRDAKSLFLLLQVNNDSLTQHIVRMTHKQACLKQTTWQISFSLLLPKNFKNPNTSSETICFCPHLTDYTHAVIQSSLIFVGNVHMGVHGELCFRQY
jgi:hypothetical protein